MEEIQNPIADLLQTSSENLRIEAWAKHTKTSINYFVQRISMELLMQSAPTQKT